MVIFSPYKGPPSNVTVPIWSKTDHQFRRECKQCFFHSYIIKYEPGDIENKLGQGHQNLSV